MRVILERDGGVARWRREDGNVFIPMTLVYEGRPPMNGELCLASGATSDAEIEAAVRGMYPRAYLSFEDR